MSLGSLKGNQLDGLQGIFFQHSLLSTGKVFSFAPKKQLLTEHTPVLVGGTCHNKKARPEKCLLVSLVVFLAEAEMQYCKSLDCKILDPGQCEPKLIERLEKDESQRAGGGLAPGIASAQLSEAGGLCRGIWRPKWKPFLGQAEGGEIRFSHRTPWEAIVCWVFSGESSETWISQLVRSGFRPSAVSAGNLAKHHKEWELQRTGAI